MTTELPPLWSGLPPHFESSYDRSKPWNLLGDPLDRALAALPSDGIEIALPPDVHLSGDRIVIRRGARLLPGAVVEGPIYIGRNAILGPGAYLRGGVWLEDEAVVGAHTEVKHAILLRRARAPHLSYVGDSVLGRDVNLGAGTMLSNFRHDGRQIHVPHGSGSLKTGRRKLGALLGDGVQVGCNCVLHPGCVVGQDTSIYPGVMLRSGIYPEGHLVKLEQLLSVARLKEPPGS